MTWTYTSTSTSFTNLNAVRFMTGDTDTTDQQFTDEEGQYAIDDEGAARPAAARICEILAAKYSRKADKAEGQLQISLSQKFDHYMLLAKRLRSAIAVLATPHAGGISITDMEAAETDTDRVVPSFTIGMQDNPPLTTSSSC